MNIKSVTKARKAGIIGMVGAVLWVAATLAEYAFGLQPPANEGAFFITNQILAFVAMAGIAVGYLGIYWGGGVDGRFGKVSVGMVVLGYGLIITAGIFVLLLKEDESPIFILFPIGGTLMSWGVLLTGIAAARAQLWQGWQRWMPLIYAGFLWLAIEIPFIAGVYPDGPGMVPEILQGIGLLLVALAVFTASGEETAVSLNAG